MIVKIRIFRFSYYSPSGLTQFSEQSLEIAKLALKSWFIQEHPEKFSHIVSYIPIEKPTTKNDPPTSIATLAQPSVEESIPSNNEFPDAQTLEPTTKLQWRDNRGDKTDFAELVWTLAKSHRIIDSKTGKPVTIDVLANQLGGLFSISVNNPMQLMQGRKDSYKATEDGITFIASLSELVEKYIANK